MQFCLGETATAGISYNLVRTALNNSVLKALMLSCGMWFFAFQALFVRQIGELPLVDAIVDSPPLKTSANLELSVRVLEEI